jgi:hypothetical protein
MAAIFIDAWKSHILQDFQFPQGFPQCAIALTALKTLCSGKNRAAKTRFSGFNFQVTPGIDLEWRLDRAGTAQNPRWQEKKRREQGKYAMDCDAGDAEGQRNQPNDGK